MICGCLALVIDNFFRMDLWGQGYGGHCHFQQYLSYIVQISFIVGGGIRSIRRKLPYDHEFNWTKNTWEINASHIPNALMTFENPIDGSIPLLLDY